MKKGNCETSLNERVVEKRDELKLRSSNEVLNFLRMDEGTFEKLLVLVGPKIQK